MHRLRAEGKFSEAEAVLKLPLVERGATLLTWFMLVFRCSDKAAEILRSLENSCMSAHLEYAARRSINEWGQRKSGAAESVDELLVSGNCD